MKKKALTFEQIAPFWSKALKKKLIKDTHTSSIIAWVGKEKHDLNDFSCCIVGEAYNFSTEYRNDCLDCLYFSQAFHLEYGNKKEFNRIKREFVKHWNEVHRK